MSYSNHFFNNPEGDDPSKSGKLSDKEFSLLSESISALPSELPYETISRGALKQIFCSPGVLKIIDPSTAHLDCLRHCKAVVRSRVRDYSPSPKGRFLVDDECLVRNNGRDYAILQFRIRDRSGTESLFVYQNVYRFPGYASLMVASLPLDSSPSDYISVRAHFTEQGMNSLTESFYYSLQNRESENDHKWENTYIGKLVASNFPREKVPALERLRISVTSKGYASLELDIESKLKGRFRAHLEHDPLYQTSKLSLEKAF